MAKKYALYVLLLLWSFGASGQKEMDNWFFGFNAGVSFSGGAPAPLPGGKVFSSEGSSSVSDENGNLLFYTDGMHIWNRQHQLMTNTKLDGDTIATQSALIVKYPGSRTLYYVFTAGAVENNTGSVKYSIVDMSLNNGLGDLKPGSVNITLADETCEKIAAIKHPNTNDIWLITHLFNSNRFLVYKIDCRGIQAQQTYDVGSVIDGRVGNAIGYLKGSPDGQYLAMASFLGNVEVFQFNNLTGEISAPRSIGSNPGHVCRSYGIEFSPHSKLLYVTSIYNCGDYGPYDIDQFDLKAPDLWTSRVNLSQGTGAAPGALQLGRDGKIYVATVGAGFLGVINEPDVVGVGCGFNAQAVTLNVNGKSGLGLPNAVSGFTRTLLGEDTTLCEPFSFTRNVTLENTTYLWSTGSTANSVTVNQYGKYWLEITTVDGCVYSDTINLSKHNSGGAYTLGNDTVLCEGNMLTLTLPQPGDSYLWQDNSTAPTYLVTSPGTYHVEVVKEGCYHSDTIRVNYKSVPNPSLGNDMVICAGQLITLDPRVYNSNVVWQDGSTEVRLTTDKQGVYKVTASNDCGSGSDEITITYGPCPQNLPNAFTPAKTTNNIFRLTNPYGVSDFSMLVYNRWGQLVFQSKDPSKGWDGRKSGVMQPPGTYVYSVSFRSAETKQLNAFKGYVILIL